MLQNSDKAFKVFIIILQKMEDKVNKIDENMEHVTRYFKYVK